MDWRPPADGDILLQFSDGESVPAHTDRLQHHAYFAALLGPNFLEGLAASKHRALKLNERWTWLKHVLHAIYDHNFRLEDVASRDFRQVLQAADRLGIAPAIEMCLAYVRRRMSATLFFELSPLLSGCIAFASVRELRRSLFCNENQHVIIAVTEDGRWQSLALGVREEVLDVLEYQLAQRVSSCANRVSQNQVTVAGAMKQCKVVPSDFADTQSKYEQLDQELSIPSRYRTSVAHASTAMHVSSQLNSELMASDVSPSSSSLRESVDMKSEAARVVSTAHAFPNAELQWSLWTSTAEG